MIFAVAVQDCLVSRVAAAVGLWMPAVRKEAVGMSERQMRPQSQCCEVIFFIFDASNRKKGAGREENNT